MARHNDRAALITGASRGLGLALARELASRGWRLIVDARAAAALERALAARGYRVTGVDWSSEFLAHARSADALRQVTWEQRDMRDLPWTARFDSALCVGNSFGYLSDDGNAAFLGAVRTALRSGGRFVLETPMVVENLLHHLQPRRWWKIHDTYLLAENEYDAATARLDIEYTFISDGRIEVRRGSHRAYTCRELTDLLTACGFAVELAEPWTLDAPSISFVATAV